jgi:hypothetical protein
LVGTYAGFSQNSFKELQLAACYLETKFSAKMRNVSTNKKRGITVFKKFVKFQRFLVLSGSDLL